MQQSDSTVTHPDKLISFNAPLGGFAQEEKSIVAAVEAGYRIVDVISNVVELRSNSNASGSAYVVLTVLLTHKDTESAYRPAHRSAGH